jgi:tetratricopeptide (TPR) repeat protein
MVTKEKEQSFNELINKSYESLEENQYTKAISFAKQANKLNPENELPLKLIILCYKKLGRFQEAEKYQSIKDDLPYIPGYWTDRAKSFQDFKVYLEHNWNALNLKKLAFSFNDRSKYKLALDYYLEAYELDKKDSDLLKKIGRLYELHFFKFEEANEYFTKAFLLNPKEEPLEEDIFALYQKTSTYKNAITFYEKAYRSYPQKIELLKR